MLTQNYLIAVLLILLMCPSRMFSQTVKSEPYHWDHVPIGGGGALPTVVFHPKVPYLKYITGDVGGPYRWDQGKKSWVYLLHSIGPEESYLHACEALAVDPNDNSGGKLYAVLGKFPEIYGRGWFFISNDQGRTWIRSNYRPYVHHYFQQLNQKLLVDPFNSSILYHASSEGLYRSFDGGMNFSKVATLPCFVLMPDEGKRTKNGGGTFMVSIDTTEGYVENPRRSKVVYVTTSIAQENKRLYVSNDGGETWEEMAGSPGGPIKMVFASDSTFYMNGDFGLFSYKNGIWKNITPAAPEIDSKGKAINNINGIAVNPRNPKFLVCSRLKNDLGNSIYRSFDGGKTWDDISKNDTTTFQAPWYPKGFERSSVFNLAFDPFNNNHVWYSDWFHPVMTEDITSPKIHWKSVDRGFEETVTIGIGGMSVPSGDVIVFIGVADVRGFAISNLNEFPLNKLEYYGTVGNSTGFDYMGNDPSFLVTVTNKHWVDDGLGFYSRNGGNHFIRMAAQPPAKIAKGKPVGAAAGRVAVSATYNVNDTIPTIVWGAEAGPYYSTDLGITWNPSNVNYHVADQKIFTCDNTLVSDKVRPNTFYFLARNDSGKYQMMRSMDGGRSFQIVNKSPFETIKKAKTNSLAVRTNPDGGKWLRAHPRKEGDLWLSSNQDGLWHSTDGGTHWLKIKQVQAADLLDLGKGPSQKSLAIYIKGVVNGNVGVFRSDDQGKSWIQINDASMKFGNNPLTLTADRKVWKRLFIGFAGFGYMYGEPQK